MGNKVAVWRALPNSVRRPGSSLRRVDRQLWIVLRIGVAIEPPTTNTWPSGNKVAVGDTRPVFIVPVGVHSPVAGSALGLKRASPAKPPATRTFPFANKVAVCLNRPVVSEPVEVQVRVAGLGTVRKHWLQFHCDRYPPPPTLSHWAGVWMCGESAEFSLPEWPSKSRRQGCKVLTSKELRCRSDRLRRGPARSSTKLPVWSRRCALMGPVTSASASCRIWYSSALFVVRELSETPPAISSLPSVNKAAA